MRWRMILASLVVLGGFGALRSSSKRRTDDADHDAIDEAGEESFPASDPPSWTLGAEPHL